MHNKNMVGAVLMDLPKVFGGIPHDLLVAKHHAYGSSKDYIRLYKIVLSCPLPPLLFLFHFDEFIGEIV